MRCPARRWIPEGGVRAAYSLTGKLSSSRPLSSARTAVITLVVLAGGRGSVEFRSQTTSPVAASMMMAARAVTYGPAARAGAASATASASARPAVLIPPILHPPAGPEWLPTADYSHANGSCSSKRRVSAKKGRRRSGRTGAAAPSSSPSKARSRDPAGARTIAPGPRGAERDRACNPAPSGRGSRRGAERAFARQVGDAAAASLPGHFMAVAPAADGALAVVRGGRRSAARGALADERIGQAVHPAPAPERRHRR